MRSAVQEKHIGGMGPLTTRDSIVVADYDGIDDTVAVTASRL